jgi:hypothetical protein
MTICEEIADWAAGLRVEDLPAGAGLGATEVAPTGSAAARF